MGTIPLNWLISVAPHRVGDEFVPISPHFNQYLRHRMELRKTFRNGLILEYPSAIDCHFYLKF
jgi:hypothetical protein